MQSLTAATNFWAHADSCRFLTLPNTRLVDCLENSCAYIGISFLILCTQRSSRCRAVSSPFKLKSSLFNWSLLSISISICFWITSFSRAIQLSCHGLLPQPLFATTHPSLGRRMCISSLSSWDAIRLHCWWSPWKAPVLCSTRTKFPGKGTALHDGWHSCWEKRALKTLPVVRHARILAWPMELRFSCGWSSQFFSTSLKILESLVFQHHCHYRQTIECPNGRKVVEVISCDIHTSLTICCFKLQKLKTYQHMSKTCDSPWSTQWFVFKTPPEKRIEWPERKTFLLSWC